MSATRESVLTIRTPEGVVFSYPLAGPMTRFLAFAIDWACVTAAMVLLNRVFSAFSVLSADAAGAIQALLYFALQTGYGMALEWRWQGQTIGKRVLRLRVMDRQALRIRFPQIALRNLLRAVDCLPLFYFVGGAAMLFSRHAQRLGDLAASTVVIRTEVVQQPQLEQFFAGKFNSLLEHRHLAARLRQRVEPTLASGAAEALLRRDEFDAERRLQLFRRFAEEFHALVQFPPEATDGLADEQYVRNVVQILYNG